jgi:hypothetical protein
MSTNKVAMAAVLAGMVFLTAFAAGQPRMMGPEDACRVRGGICKWGCVQLNGMWSSASGYWHHTNQTAFYSTADPPNGGYQSRVSPNTILRRCSSGVTECPEMAHSRASGVTGCVVHDPSVTRYECKCAVYP